MKFVIVDTVRHGHHPLYVRSFALALASIGDVVVLAPDDLFEAAGPLDVVHHTIEHQVSPREQLKRAAQAAVAVGADHVIHLYGVRAQIAAWLTSRPLPVKGSVVVISPPVLHYPKMYSSGLSHREVLGAVAKESLVQAWRLRPDAHAMWTVDGGALSRWSRWPGARVYQLREPPASAPEGQARVEFDCVVYGALGPLKGLDLLAAAVAADGQPLNILVAGRVLPANRGFVDANVAKMRAAASTVTVRDGWISDAEVPAMLASAACAVLSYPRHKGNSRVLIEAASAGTPVVTNDWGLLGETVRRGRLGLAVDCSHPPSLRRAIERLSTPGVRATFAASLDRFAAEHDWSSFSASIVAPFSS